MNRYILLLIVISSCTTTTVEVPNPVNSEGAADHLKFFGFTLIDTYFDDPTDLEEKSNYAKEVDAFCNLADILVVSPADNINDRIAYMTQLKMQSVLHLHELFFELVDNEAPSGANYDLRDDYFQRWEDFTSLNVGSLTYDQIGAFYLGEEPTWNGINFEELDKVCMLVKDTYPDIPIMIIEAFPILEELRVPKSADWIGFDHYFIKDPSSDPDYQLEWSILKTKLSSSAQRIMLVMDTHHIDWAHGDFGNISLDEMGEVAQNYFDLAQSDSLVVGILGYFWPNGFDIPGSIGARGMSNEIQSVYQRIGKEITGK